MRLAAILPLVFLAPALAQIQPALAQIQKVASPAAPTVGTQAETPKVARGTITGLEKLFDSQIARVGGANDPVDMLGLTRGIYLDGYGAVFTAEVSLIVTPAVSPFRPVITDKLKEEVHQRKLDHLKLLEAAMRDMVRSTAMTFNSAGEKVGVLTPGTQIVLAVRLLYLPWENTIGLPGQIAMKADLKSALEGKIQEEVQ